MSMKSTSACGRPRLCATVSASVGLPADRTTDGGGGDMDYPYDLGPYSRKVTTSSTDAQRWFDRGLNWCFGFHHEEAVAEP